MVSPAQVGFSPAGNQLVVTVKGVHPTHQIHLFGIDGNGLPSAQPVTTIFPTTVPFGFVFDPAGHLFVAKPFGNQFNGTPAGNLSAASSYTVAANGSLTAISSFSVAPDGSLSLLNATAATAGDHPVDLTLSSDGNYLYNVNAGAGTVSIYRVNSADGSLTALGAVPGLPANGSAVGIVAR